MPRFDIGPAAEFESRDGGVGTGGLVRNGFLEEDEGVWSWQRPALAPGMAAPFSGTALGMLVLGTTLYGIGVATSGTASSYTITPGSTPFVLNVGRVGTSTLDDVVAGFLSGVLGGLSPSTWKGAPVAVLVSGGTTQVLATTILAFSGSVASNFITGLTLQGQTFRTATAVYSTIGWIWPSVLISTSTGTYTGRFF